jgi:hypothetical protein
MPGALPRATRCTGATYSLSRLCEYPRETIRQKTTIYAKRLALIIALDLTPKSVGQIDNDWFGSAPHHDPLEGKSFRRVDFLVGYLSPGEMMRQYVVVHAAVIVVLERAARRERKESDGGTGQATDYRCAHASV